MEKENLIIAYGDDKVTLNKGEEHITLTREDMAFIFRSSIKAKIINTDITVTPRYDD